MHELLRLKWMWQPLMIFPNAAQAFQPPAPAAPNLPTPAPPIQQPQGSPTAKQTKPTFLAGAPQAPPQQTGLKTLLGQ